MKGSNAGGRIIRVATLLSNQSKSSSSQGSTRFRQLVQSELDELRQAPVFLISGEASNEGLISGTARKVKQVTDACQFVKFTLGQQFGLRLVESHIFSVFPTLGDVDKRADLMQRTGASTIVAVGSGAAMDLAKSLIHTRDNTQSPFKLILVPSTFCAVLASGMSHSLLLDTIEEQLVPLPREHVDWNTTIVEQGDAMTYHDTKSWSSTMVAPLDVHKYIEPLDEAQLNTLLQAVAALLLDAAIQDASHPLLPPLIDSTLELIKQPKRDNKNMVISVTNLLFQSASLLSYGLVAPGNTKDRSITLALMTSLLPTIFPETPTTTFLSSLIPGLCHVSASMMTDSCLQRRIDMLVDVLRNQPRHHLPKVVVHEEYKGFSVPDMALNSIQSNQQVWRCLDANLDILMTVLQHSFPKS